MRPSPGIIPKHIDGVVHIIVDERDYSIDAVCNAVAVEGSQLLGGGKRTTLVPPNPVMSCEMLPTEGKSSHDSRVGMDLRIPDSDNPAPQSTVDRHWLADRLMDVVGKPCG